MQTVSVNGKDVFPRAKVVGIEMMQTAPAKSGVNATAVDTQSTAAAGQPSTQPIQQAAIVTAAPSTVTTNSTATASATVPATATATATATAPATATEPAAAAALVPSTAAIVDQAPASSSATVNADKDAEEASEESSIVTPDYIQQST